MSLRRYQSPLSRTGMGLPAASCISASRRIRRKRSERTSASPYQSSSENKTMQQKQISAHVLVLIALICQTAPASIRFFAPKRVGLVELRGTLLDGLPDGQSEVTHTPGHMTRWLLFSRERPLSLLWSHFRHGYLIDLQVLYRAHVGILPLHTPKYIKIGLSKL